MQVEYSFTPLQIKWRELFQKNKWLCTKYLCGFNEGAVARHEITHPMYKYLHGRFLNMVQHNPWRNLAVFMGRGFFKCLAPNSLITLPNGISVCAKDVNVGDKILSWEKDGFIFKEILNKRWNSSQQILSFSLRSGQKLEISDNHPVMTINGWKDAQRLQVGERIMVWAGDKMNGGGEHNPDLMWLLGFFIGDGCCVRQKRGSCKCSFTTFNADILKRVRRICKKFGFKVKKISKTRKGQYTIINGFRKILWEYNVAGKNSWTKDVPVRVFDMDLESRRAFIGGYFSADGSFTKLGKAYICTVSRNLAYSVNTLLKTIGCFSKVSYYEYPDKKFSPKFYRIDIASPISIKNLRECEIYKQNDCGIIPSQDGFWQSVPKEWRKDGVPKGLRARGIRADRKTYDTSYTKFRKFAIEANKEWACKDNVVWDEIMYIGLIESETIDLEVRDTHTIVVNGVVTHNSSMMTVGDNIHNIINNPNIRIAIGNTNESLGKGFVRQLKKIIKSPLFMALYPDIVPTLPPNHPDSNWSKTSFTVNRTARHGEPTVMIITPRTDTEGLHFDRLLGNDLVNRKNYRSEVLREQTKEFVRNFTNLKDNPNVPIIIEGTFWHPDDLYVADILPNEEYTIFYLPLYDDSGNITFPEKFTPEYIEAIRREMGDKMFTTQMLLNPISEQEAFMSKYPFVKYEEKGGKRITTDGREFTAPIIGRMVAMDTAGRGKNLAAVGMVELDNEGNYFVRYVKLRDRWKPSQRLVEFKNIQKWFNPTKFGVELEGLLMWDSVLPEDFVEGKSDLRLKLDRLTTGGQHKPERIQNIEPPLANGRIFWHIGIGERAIKEVQFYPEMMDDAVPDVISYCLLMFPKHHIYPTEQVDLSSVYWEPQHPEMFNYGRQVDESLLRLLNDRAFEEELKDDVRIDGKRRK